jgi:hypothetical protein
MFDVHYFLFPIKLDALLSNGRADTSYETSSHTERSEITARQSRNQVNCQLLNIYKLISI